MTRRRGIGSTRSGAHFATTDQTPGHTKKRAPPENRWGSFTLNVGGDLLSHTLTSAVPSALEGLASGFGMGPGVPHSATTTDNTIPLSPADLLDGSNTPPHPQPGNPDQGGHGCALRVTQWMRTTTRERGNCCGQALGLLVPVDSTPHSASIPGLSTPSSLGGLTHARWWETSSWNELPA